jgi:hypothetical protein
VTVYEKKTKLIDMRRNEISFGLFINSIYLRIWRNEEKFVFVIMAEVKNGDILLSGKITWYPNP